MEEAGDRVDSNIDELKREYTEKLRKMEVLYKKVRYRHSYAWRAACLLQPAKYVIFFFLICSQATVSNDIGSKKNELTQTRIAFLEEKVEQTLKANNGLDRELQVASKTIVRLKW